MKIKRVYAAVLGSGASGLAAAVRLNSEGVDDVVVLTEGLDKGTSINTGSDKQTYYKLGMCGSSPDSPKALAETYLAAGGADGDLALVEAAVSARAFYHLVNLGVPFPCDPFGQYAGYKTDHDPAKRATSCGPYTSREMCRALIGEVKRRNIQVYEGQIAVKLLTRDVDSNECPKRKRVVGVLTIDPQGEPCLYYAQNVVFAVGGPGGLYKTSVYPEVHTGSIGLALEIGALAKGLPESQFGLASFTDLSGRTLRGSNANNPPKEFRWNVSGTFMQVVPKFVSTDPDGKSNPREFLRDYFDDPKEIFTRVFLKGYQWPFDVRKAIDGSSYVDLCVFCETAIKGRRVFLDYRENPQDFAFESLGSEAYDYLKNSDAFLATPFERLQKMNPNAIELYRDWGLDLAEEPLEIGVCAQHNNGGLAVDCWWRSLNIDGLFPIGEVAGTHGVARPGGSALNAGQVGAFRAAEYIGLEYRLSNENSEKNVRDETTYSLDSWIAASTSASGKGLAEFLPDLSTVGGVLRVAQAARIAGIDWRKERDELRRRMSETAGVFRNKAKLAAAVNEARAQLTRICAKDVETSDQFDDMTRLTADDVENLRNIQLCVSQIAYMDAILTSALVGVGSRGSAIVLDRSGKTISSKLPDDWKMQEENPIYRAKILYSYVSGASADGVLETGSFWRDVKPIPEPEEWFENVWRDYRERREGKKER